MNDYECTQGTLLPKPFFARWVVPGLLIQLLVNPGLKPASRALSALLAYAHSAGLAGYGRAVVWALPVAGWLWPRLHHEVYHFVLETKRNSPDASSLFHPHRHPKKAAATAKAIEEGRRAAKAKKEALQQRKQGEGTKREGDEGTVASRCR